MEGGLIVEDVIMEECGCPLMDLGAYAVTISYYVCGLLGKVGSNCNWYEFALV